MKANPLHFSIATRIREKHFLELLKLQPGGKLLDVGCGLGYFSQLLSVENARSFGMDVDFEAVLYAKRNIDESRFIVGEAEHLPFKNNCFNKILCSEVLEHIQNDKEAVSEIHRVCKNGAEILITVPTEEGIFGSRIKEIGHKGRNRNSRECHYRDGYKWIELATLLRENVIEPVECRYSMVFFTELFMGFTKIIYLLKHRSLDSQADILKVKDSFLLKLVKVIFPFILFISRVEELLLAKLLKGHMLIMTGIVRKCLSE